MQRSHPMLSVARGLCILALITAAFAVSTPQAAAQSFVFRGGVNLSKFVGGGDVRSDTKPGLNLGGSFRLVGFGPFALWAEGYYRQKGADNLQQLADGSTTLPDKVQVGIDYVEVPVLLRLNLLSGHRIRPYVQGGPTFGWKLNCSVILSTQSGTATPDCDQLLGGNVAATLRSYERGVAFGGGLDLDVLRGMGALNLDARVTRGLSRLSENAAGPGVKNQSVTLMLGYSLHLPGLGGPGMGPLE